MRKILFIGALLLGSLALAQSQFRQSILQFEVRGVVDLRDGGVTTTISCATGPESPLVDGGVWPLRVRFGGPVTGGNPNQVIRACAQQIQAANGLDGGG